MTNESLVEKVFLLWSNESKIYISLRKVLVDSGWKIVLITGTQTLKNCIDGTLFGGQLVCLGLLNPTLGPTEHEVVHEFCSAGNSMIVAAGDNENVGHLNSVVAKFGVEFNEDCVIRPNLYRHFHPKDALLEDFIANRGLEDSLKRYVGSKSKTDIINDEAEQMIKARSLIGAECGPRIIYSRGCTLKITNRTKSTVMMTSSKWAVPNSQAICSFHKDSATKCRMIAIGSASMFSDEYLNAEDNKYLLSSLLDFIVEENFFINVSDARTTEIPEAVYGPDIGRLVDVPIPCLQQSEELPEDKLVLLDKHLFSTDLSIIPTIMRAYRDLRVPHLPLTLIKPNFLLKQLDLEPATHGFILRRPQTNQKD